MKGDALDGTAREASGRIIAALAARFPAGVTDRPYRNTTAAAPRLSGGASR